MTTIMVSGSGMSELRQGDIITIAGDFKNHPWWKFWLWFKPKQLRQYRIGEESKNNSVITIEVKHGA